MGADALRGAREKRLDGASPTGCALSSWATSGAPASGDGPGRGLPGPLGLACGSPHSAPFHTLSVLGPPSETGAGQVWRNRLCYKLFLGT